MTILIKNPTVQNILMKLNDVEYISKAKLTIESNLTYTHVHMLVGRLQKMKILVSIRAKENKRACKISLTPKGKKVCDLLIQLNSLMVEKID